MLVGRHRLELMRHIYNAGESGVSGDSFDKDDAWSSCVLETSGAGGARWVTAENLATAASILPTSMCVVNLHCMCPSDTQLRFQLSTRFLINYFYHVFIASLLASRCCCQLRLFSNLFLSSQTEAGADEGDVSEWSGDVSRVS